MKKILITGNAGFIGSHLSEKLLQLGHSVVGIDNFDAFYSRKIKQKNLLNQFPYSTFSFIEGSICDETLFKKLPADIELVIHLAAKAGVRPSIIHPLEFCKTNIVGTQNILEWMKSNACKKMIFASSSSVYGNNKKIPFSETDACDNPISPYAFTKKSCELSNYNYHHLYNFSIVNLRFFTVYGPRQRPDLAIHKFFNKIYNNQPIEVYGDGNTGRDYTFINDIINGISATINFIDTIGSPVYETINLGNSSPIKLLDLINEIQNIIGKPANMINLPMQSGDVNYTFSDISKAQKLLNYNPKTTLREGLTQFKDWLEQNEH